MAVTHKQRRNAYRALYKAVGRYVHLQGGRVVIALGIEVQEWDGTSRGEFTIAINCSGRKPTFATEHANTGRAK